MHLKRRKLKTENNYLARRLILHVKIKMWKSYKLRNQINDAFNQKESIINPIITSVTRSKIGFSIILTTMSKYNTEFLLEK